jgi:hypothetical protein
MSFKRNVLRCILISFFLTALNWQSQASAGELQLAWTDNSNNEDGFKIERKTGTTGTYTQLATVGANVTVYIDTNLVDGATYCYRVAAFNAAGTSAYTVEGCAAARSTVQQISGIGIFRLSTAEWYFGSGNGSGCGVNACLAFGMPGDVPVPVDYDGDGKTDVAVYRNGGWYILRSSDGGVTFKAWGGMAQDIPVPRDYDGDGKADIAVYRDGMWYIVRSSDGGQMAVGWGGMVQDIPVYRDGTWYILRSSDGGVTATGWGGMAQDIPLPTDYDGDRKTDIAVYRNGEWYILRSSDGGVTYVQLGGAADDIPLN